LIAPALAAVLAPSAALSGAVPVANGIGTWEVPVESMTKMRFRSVVAQQYDFSCGSAALATLLTFHYGREVPESVAFDGMFRVGDQETIRQQGFSMLDMKRYLESEHGLAADGFHVKLSDLKELGVPGIVMIETRGYRHFVVVKGVGDERVLRPTGYGVTRTRSSNICSRTISCSSFVTSSIPRGGVSTTRACGPPSRTLLPRRPCLAPHSRA
jgi:hypothetical protein